MTYLSENELLGFDALNSLGAIVIGLAGLLPIAGLAKARRGLLGGTEHKAAPLLGLIFNAGLLLLSAAFYVWVVRFYFFLPRVEGSVLINGEPAGDAELFLQPRCTHEMVYEDPSTWCYSDYALGSELRPDGTFTFWDVEPGEYSFHATLDQPAAGECTTDDPTLEVENNNPWYRFDKVVLSMHSTVPVSAGMGKRFSLDIHLVCQ